MNRALFLLWFLVAVPASATQYFLNTAAGGGSDSNNGTSAGTPWLSPNHAVNCGDVITAAASTSYSSANFTEGKWGTVTCPAGNNVAWLKCAVFDGCKISASGQDAIGVSSSYWGVQGWETTTAGSFSACFVAQNSDSATTIHHIVFANNVANGCSSGGISGYLHGTGSVDYLAIVGNIVYNAAQNGSFCYSGISIYEPIAVDSLPGTHMYVAGNLSYGNVEPSPCDGTAPTDGEGVIFDTWDAQQSALATPYAQQGAIENNILVSNGGRGIEVFNNYKYGSTGPPFAHIYVVSNTMWGNNTNATQSSGYCSELLLAFTVTTIAYGDLAATNATDGCGGIPIYGFQAGNLDSTSHVYNSWAYSAAGTNTIINSSPGFSFGPGNTLGVNPSFASPTAPSAPSCGSFPSGPACMAQVIANFRPTNAAAAAYGYQPPSAGSVFDPLFPQWLCNVNLPAGLVTMGCLTGTAVGGGVTIGPGVTIH